MLELLPLILTIILFLLGIIGTFIPIMPGVALIWLGMLLYGFLTGFEHFSLGFYVVQGLAAVLVLGVDYIATALGTKKFDGSKASIWGASLGLFVGIITLGPIGIIIGPFLGAMIGEVLNNSSLERAIRVSIGSLIGILGGLFLKLVIEMAMIIWFFVKIMS